MLPRVGLLWLGVLGFLIGVLMLILIVAVVSRCVILGRMLKHRRILVDEAEDDVEDDDEGDDEGEAEGQVNVLHFSDASDASDASE